MTLTKEKWNVKFKHLKDRNISDKIIYIIET